MKKPIKSILASSLLALAFGAVSVGGTFALFTDRAETTVEIGSGKLDVSSSITNFKTYSAKADVNGDRIDENNEKYTSTLTEVQGVFANSGTAAFEGSTITLSRITPGDRVTFDVELDSDSNINFKYRGVYKLITDDQTLAKGLQTKTNLFTGSDDVDTFNGLLEGATTWQNIADKDLRTISFDIELPIERGNNYQEKQAKFVFSLEAVQGNAVTSNEDGRTICGIEDMVQSAVATEEDLSLTATASSTPVTVKTVIPASEVNAGDKVELTVSDMVIDRTHHAESSLDFDITLKVNDVVQSSFDEIIQVEVYIGKGLTINEVSHNNVPVTNYSYNSDTGILSFTTTSFSPFKVKYTEPVIGGGEGMIEEDEDN